MRLQRWVPAALIAVAMAGCRGDDEGGTKTAAGGGTDPAQAIGADSPVFVEAVLRPEGDQADNVEALLGRFLGDKTLTELLDEQLAKDGKSYAEDIEPWLGSETAIGVYDLAAEEPSFIVAVSITDADAAEAAISESENTKPGPTLGDVATYTSGDDAVAGVTDDLLLVAQSQDGVQRALDTLEGDSLGDSERFADALDGLPEERLGALYFDTSALADLAAQDPTLDPAGKQVLEQFLGDGAPITGALVAEPDAARGEFRVSTEGFGPFGSLISGESPDLLADMPASSWFAFGYQDVGETLKQTIETFAGALGGAALTGQFEQQTGLNLDRDVFSWIGDLALFVRGDTIESLDGGVVIEASDEDAAKAAIPKLAQAAKQSGAPIREAAIDGAELAYTLPIGAPAGPLVVAYGNGRAVFAIGELAAEDGLSASETIEDSGLYGRASDAIDGVAPSFILDYKGILLLAESGGAIDDPEYAEVRPYLEMLDLIVAGAEVDGDELRSLFAVKVK